MNINSQRLKFATMEFILIILIKRRKLYSIERLLQHALTCLPKEWNVLKRDNSQRSQFQANTSQCMWHMHVDKRIATEISSMQLGNES